MECFTLDLLCKICAGTEEKSPVSKAESSVATKTLENVKKVEAIKPVEKETKLVKTPEVEQPAVRPQSVSESKGRRPRPRRRPRWWWSARK